MSSFAIAGRSQPAGSSPTMASIFSRTSCAATSTSVPIANSTIVLPAFSKQVEYVCLSPSTPETASSMRLATSFSMSSDDAPGHTVVIVTYGTSTLGRFSSESLR